MRSRDADSDCVSPLESGATLLLLAAVIPPQLVLLLTLISSLTLEVCTGNAFHLPYATTAVQQ